ERERLLADPGAQPAAGEVVDRDVDAAEESRDPRLVGRVVVGRPLERDRPARPALELERAGTERLLVEAAGAVPAAGGRRQHLRRGAAERAVPGDVAGEGGRDEVRSLVGDPVGAE